MKLGLGSGLRFSPAKRAWDMPASQSNSVLETWTQADFCYSAHMAQSPMPALVGPQGPRRGRWRDISEHRPTYRDSSILAETRVKFLKSPFSGGDRANRSLSAMCDEQDALVDNLYPLTLDRAVMHSLVECRGERA